MLHRPLTGWPKLGPVDPIERAVVKYAIIKFYNESELKTLLLRRIDLDTALNTVSSMVLHSLPENFSL